MLFVKSGNWGYLLQQQSSRAPRQIPCNSAPTVFYISHLQAFCTPGPCGKCAGDSVRAGGCWRGSSSRGAVGTSIQKRLFQSRAVSTSVPAPPFSKTLESQNSNLSSLTVPLCKSGQQPSLFGYWDSRGPKVFSLEV